MKATLENDTIPLHSHLKGNTMSAQMHPNDDHPSYFGVTTKMLTKTIPFLGLNVLVYAGFFFVGLVWMSLWGGLAWLTAKFAPVIAYVCVFIGLAAFGGLWKFAKRYILYLVKGAHIAALTRMITGNPIPGGMNQISFGREVVESNFKDVSILFGLDALINGVLKAISRKIIRVTRWLPLPDGFDKAVRAITEIINRSLTYVDEAILSYAIAEGDDNIWNSARHGIILYAQSYKPILITAVKVWLVGKVFFIGLFVIFLVPAAFAAAAVQVSWLQIIFVVFAFIAAALVEKALFEPFAMTYTLVTYHYTIAGQVPDPEWDARLKGVSDKFDELLEKAKGGAKTPFKPRPRPQVAVD